MKRILLMAAGVIAVALVPCLLYLAITRLGGTQTAQFSFWAPLCVLAADALAFYVALGFWSLRAWDRVGLAIILPMLLAMVSWASMMGMVEKQRLQYQATSAENAAPTHPETRAP